MKCDQINCPILNSQTITCYVINLHRLTWYFIRFWRDATNKHVYWWTFPVYACTCFFTCVYLCMYERGGGRGWGRCKAIEVTGLAPMVHLPTTGKNALDRLLRLNSVLLDIKDI